MRVRIRYPREIYHPEVAQELMERVATGVRKLSDRITPNVGWAQYGDTAQSVQGIRVHRSEPKQCLRQATARFLCLPDTDEY